MSEPLTPPDRYHAAELRAEAMSEEQAGEIERRVCGRSPFTQGETCRRCDAKPGERCPEEPTPETP